MCSQFQSLGFSSFDKNVNKEQNKKLTPRLSHTNDFLSGGEIVIKQLSTRTG